MNEVVPHLKSLKAGDAVLDMDFLLQAAYEDISEAAEQIPAAIGWLGYQRSLALQRLIMDEQEIKVAESTQYFELKNGGYTSQGFGDSKPSEEALKRAIPLTDAVKASYKNYALSKRHIDWISSSIDALQAKLELVRSSEATKRMEHAQDRRGTIH